MADEAYYMLEYYNPGRREAGGVWTPGREHTNKWLAITEMATRNRHERRIVSQQRWYVRIHRSDEES